MRGFRTVGMRLLLCWAALALACGGPESGSMLFLSPQSNPIALSGDGSVLYVANTTSGTLSMLDVSGPGEPQLLAEVHVGLDPVGVAVRPKLDTADATEDELVLVANHVSDSVSVVSRERAAVVQTVQVRGPDGVSRSNEPTGVAFASRDRAFVTLDDPNQVLVLDFDAAGRVSVNPNRLEITAQGPRAITAANGLVYVAAFESGNQTEFPTCAAIIDSRGLDESDPDDEGCEFDVQVDGNRFVFDPNLGGRIIRDRDQPDRDLFVYDAETLALVEVVETLGTLHYGIASNGSDVFLATTEARNQLDGLDALGNHMFENRLVALDCAGGCAAGASLVDLDDAAGEPVPTPYGIAVSSDGDDLVITASGSDGGGVTPGLFVVSADGVVRGSAPVGAIPSGVALRSALDGSAETAFVLNTADSSVSVVDVTDPAAPAVLHTLEVGADPTPDEIRRGRIAFASASASTGGTFSCESCHPQGHTDQLQWTINTVQGPNDGVGISGEKPEPRTTMPVRGLRGTLPLHWDGTLGDPLPGVFLPGDSEGDCDIAADGPLSCFRHLVDSSLKGVMCEQPCNDGGALDDADRDAMAAFLRVLPYPPSPLRAPDDVPSTEALQGQIDFFTNEDGQGTQSILTCGSAGAGCHALPLSVGTNSGFVGAFDAPTIRGMWDRFLLFSNGMFQAEEAMAFLAVLNSQPVWDPAVGHTERGSLLATFPDSPAAVASGAGFLSIYGVRGEDIWQMINELSVGFSGALGEQVEVTPATASDADVVGAMDRIEAFAAEGRVVAVARSGDLGEFRVDPVDGRWRQGETLVSGAALRQQVVDHGSAVLTVTAEHAPGVAVGVDQPLLWGSIPEPQAGAESSFLLFSESVDPDAHVLVDGVRCAACSFVQLDAEDPTRTVVTLSPAPAPGPHVLQLHNPAGLASNEVPLIAR